MDILQGISYKLRVILLKNVNDSKFMKTFTLFMFTLSYFYKYITKNTCILACRILIDLTNISEDVV